MPDQNFLIIGGGVLQLNFINAVRAKGYRAIVCDLDEHCPGAVFSDEFHPISTNDTVSILQLARSRSIVGVGSVAAEAANLSTCLVASELGLLGNPKQCVEQTTDKLRMKRRLIDAGIATAEVVSTIDCKAGPLQPTLQDSDYERGFVVKPADSSGGRGVSYVRDRDQCALAIERARQMSQSGAVLIERCLTGPQYSLEGISYEGQHRLVAIAEEHFDEVFVTMETQQLVPARLSNEQYIMAANLLVETLDALGVRTGASHLECRWVNGQFYVIECASRAGGWRDELIWHSLGVDYNFMLVDCLTSRGKIPSSFPVDHCRTAFVKKKENEKRVAIVKILFTDRDARVLDNLLRMHPEWVHGLHKRATSNAPCSLADNAGFYYVTCLVEAADGILADNRQIE